MERLTIKLAYNGSLTRYLTYLIVLVSLFLVFFSYTNASFGIECILLSVLLLLLNLKTRYIMELFPFISICGITIIMYFFSGQTSVRGFNAPVNHVLKFVYLMFTVALSIGMRELSKKNRAKAIKWMLVSVLISVMISAFYAIFVDKYAIRYPEERGLHNVVDFAQFYGICIILCVLMFALLRFKKRYVIWKQILYCFPIIVCIAVSLYVTGVLITAIGFGIGFAFHKCDSSKPKAALWAFIIILLFGIMITFSTQISDWIYKITEPLNWILKDRLRSVADTIFKTNHNLSYSYDRRDELANYSLTTFKNHPVFGIGYKEYGYGTIGGHQEWQDLLGVFGIVGAIILGLAFLFLVKITVKNIDNQIDLHAFYIAVIVFFILGLLNPCLNLPVLTAVFVVAPNISLIIPERKPPSNQEDVGITS